MNLNWMQLSPLQLHWVQEISQSALAAAVAALGLVILLELASISRLRRAMDGQLQRVFEQLDLLRGESQQLIQAQASVPAPNVPAAPPSHPATPATTSNQLAAAYTPPPLAAGEARLVAALTAARARLTRSEGGAGLR